MGAEAFVDMAAPCPYKSLIYIILTYKFPAVAGATCRRPYRSTIYT